MKKDKLIKLIQDGVREFFSDNDIRIWDIKRTVDDVDKLKGRVSDQQRMIEILLSKNNMVICPQCKGETSIGLIDCLMCGKEGVVEISLEEPVSTNGEN